MAYKVVETRSAGKDIAEILGYIAGTLGNLPAAALFADELASKYESLSENPYMYEQSRDLLLKSRGYRRVVIKNYVMLYLVDQAAREVHIVRVIYGGRDYAELI